MSFRFDIIYEYREMFFYGALTTLGITVVSTFAGTILGLIGALARVIRAEKGGFPVKAIIWLARQISLIYVTLFRGTPLFVQIFIWYFVWFPILINPTDGLLISGDAAMELRRVCQRPASRRRRKRSSIAASAAGFSRWRKSRTSSQPSVASW